ncbi:MAG: 2-isopropylmalate synthase [Archaeoglobi archaeon]|nr:2-isopropylmalate synthase [Candidatus Mnemosynella bozhongmuii]
MKGERVYIFDTTLRDGEQTPGVSFTEDEKLSIARQLDALGVDVIEAGFPASSEWEKEMVRKVVRERPRAKVCGLARIRKEDIDECIEADVDMIHVFVPTSEVQRKYVLGKSKEEVKEDAVKAVEYVKDHGMECMFSAMDATRTEIDYLVEIYSRVVEAGADVVNVPDTVGIATPFTMIEIVREVTKSRAPLIDVHCHNDFGMAVANTLAGVLGGAREVQVTVNGIGERAGNADLAQTVMILHSLFGAKTNIKTELLYETSKLVERYSGIRLPPTTPIVGENAFSHESGIHSHGVLQNYETFEPGVMTPEMVGHRRRIVAGKHAGRHGIKAILSEYGIHPSEEELNEIMRKVKELAAKGKHVTDADLVAIAEITCEVRGGERPFVLEELSVMTGNRITPTAVIRAKIRGEERRGAEIGVGPVDAAVKAVRSILKDQMDIRLRDFRIEAITGGSDALGEVVIGIEDDRGRISTARSAHEDIVMASVEAMINAINRLMMRDEGKSD